MPVDVGYDTMKALIGILSCLKNLCCWQRVSVLIHNDTADLACGGFLSRCHRSTRQNHHHDEHQQVMQQMI